MGLGFDASGVAEVVAIKAIGIVERLHVHGNVGGSDEGCGVSERGCQPLVVGHQEVLLQGRRAVAAIWRKTEEAAQVFHVNAQFFQETARRRIGGVETRGNVVFFKHFLQLLAQGRACRSAREGGKTVGNEAKGEFVGLASHRLRHEGLHKTAICAADGKVGVLRRERAEPVGHDVEERHALHQLLECREEHVCSLLGKLLYLLYLAPPRSIGLNVPYRRVLTFRV